jgi:hypothetical protein
VGDVTPTWSLIVALGYSALLVSVVGYLLWFHLLTTSGATAASAYHFMMPPLGMLFGWLLLGERVAPADLIGIVPVALGIYLVTRPAAAPKAQVGLSNGGRGGTIAAGARMLREDRTRNRTGASTCPTQSTRGAT